VPFDTCSLFRRRASASNQAPRDVCNAKAHEMSRDASWFQRVGKCGS
jgi:hypothetical protein